jgi:hypothetical protein
MRARGCDSTTRGVLTTSRPSCMADICSIINARVPPALRDSLTSHDLNKDDVFRCAYVKSIGTKSCLCYNRGSNEGEEYRAFPFRIPQDVVYNRTMSAALSFVRIGWRHGSARVNAGEFAGCRGLDGPPCRGCFRTSASRGTCWHFWGTGS